MLNRIKNSTFAKNVLLLAGGNTIAQAISFISLPILQKWFYNPSEFGLLAVYNSIATILIAVSTFKLEYAIVLANSEKNSVAIRKVTTKIVLYVSLLSFVLIALFGKSISNYLGNDQIYIYLYLVPINVLFVGTYEAYNYWYNYKSEYKILATSKVIQTTVAEVFKYSIKLISNIAGGLIIGRVLGQISSSLSLILNKKNRNENLEKVEVDFSKILKEHKNFPQYILPAVFINTLTNSILILFISRYFNSTYVGLVSGAVLYLQTPLSILSRSVSQVFYKRISEISKKSDIRKLYIKSAYTLTIIIIIPVLAIIIVPNYWFESVLGSEWKDIGIYMKIMISWISISFITSSLSFIYNRIKRQKLILIFALSQLVGVTLCLWVSIVYCEASLKTTVMVYAFFQSCYYLATLFLAMNYLKEPEQ